MGGDEGESEGEEDFTGGLQSEGRTASLFLLATAIPSDQYNARVIECLCILDDHSHTHTGGGGQVVGGVVGGLLSLLALAVLLVTLFYCLWMVRRKRRKQGGLACRVRVRTASVV